MEKKEIGFESWVHRFGISSSLLLFCGMMGFPVAVSVVYGIWPSLADSWPGVVAVLLFMLPWLPGETIGYMSIMGPGALYMSYITGNVTNLRMPATVGTINALKIEPNSEKCHTMAILVCGASIITSTVILAAGVLLSSQLKPILEAEVLQPAFTYVVPALFGGLVAQTVLKGAKHFLLYLVPLAVCLICRYVFSISGAYYMLIAILCSAMVFVANYKAQKKTETVGLLENESDT